MSKLAILTLTGAELELCKRQDLAVVGYPGKVAQRARKQQILSLLRSRFNAGDENQIVRYSGKEIGSAATLIAMPPSFAACPGLARTGSIPWLHIYMAELAQKPGALAQTFPMSLMPIYDMIKNHIDAAPKDGNPYPSSLRRPLIEEDGPDSCTFTDTIIASFSAAVPNGYLIYLRHEQALLDAPHQETVTLTYCHKSNPKGDYPEGTDHGLTGAEARTRVKALLETRTAAPPAKSLT